MPSDAAPDSQFSFGIIADCQYADGDAVAEAPDLIPEAPVPEVRYFRESADRLQQAISALNDHDLAFVAHLGDLIDRSPDDLAVLTAAFDRSTVPVLQVLGNHDLASFRGDLSATMKAYGMTASYYRHQVGDVRFLILDTNQEAALTETPGSPAWEQQRDRLAKLLAQGQVNAQTWNGAVGAEQLAWITSQLDEAADAGERVILLAHQPLLPHEKHVLLNADAVLEVIEGSPQVVAYLNGHRHCGDLVERDNRPYVTFKAMVNTTESAYAVCTVFSDRLEIDGFGREPSRVLPLRQVSSARASGSA